MKVKFLIAILSVTSSNFCIDETDFLINYDIKAVDQFPGTEFEFAEKSNVFLYKDKPMQKKVFPFNQNGKKEAYETIKALKLFENIPNAVKLYFCVTEKNDVSLYTELTQGDLQTELSTFQKGTWTNKLILILSLVRGFENLHQMGFVSTNICPKKFSFSFDRKIIKITNLHQAVPANSVLEISTPTNSPNEMEFYAPPQRSMGKEPNFPFAQNCWSLTVSLFELLIPNFRKNFFADTTYPEVTDISKRLLRSAQTQLEELSQRTQIPFSSVMKDWLQYKPDHRPKISQIANGIKQLLKFSYKKDLEASNAFKIVNSAFEKKEKTSIGKIVFQGNKSSTKNKKKFSKK